MISAMDTLPGFEFVRRTQLGLYAVDDPTDALDAVFDVSVLAGTPVVDASLWFPHGNDFAEKVHLATDVYSYAAKQNLATHIEDVLASTGESLLDAASKSVEFSDDPIRLGFGVAVTNLGRYAVLASCVGDPSTGDTAALLAIGDAAGELVHLLRLRAVAAGSASVLAEPLEASARLLARFCCGVTTA
jgi:hypothetical protein